MIRDEIAEKFGERGTLKALSQQIAWALTGQSYCRGEPVRFVDICFLNRAPASQVPGADQELPYPKSPSSCSESLSPPSSSSSGSLKRLPASAQASMYGVGVGSSQVRKPYPNRGRWCS